MLVIDDKKSGKDFFLSFFGCRTFIPLLTLKILCSCFYPVIFLALFFPLAQPVILLKKRYKLRFQMSFFLLICKKFLFFLRPQFFAFRFPLLEFCKPERISFFRLSAIQKNKEKRIRYYTQFTRFVFFFSPSSVIKCW